MQETVTLDSRIVSAAKKAGWEETPSCPWIRLDDTGEIVCTHALTQFRKRNYGNPVIGADECRPEICPKMFRPKFEKKNQSDSLEEEKLFLFQDV